MNDSDKSSLAISPDSLAINSSLASGKFTVTTSNIRANNITFRHGSHPGGSVTIDLDKGEVIIEGEMTLPEAARVFWESIRESMICDYKILPLDEYKQLLSQASRGNRDQG